jgi:hypothetical protein
MIERVSDGFAKLTLGQRDLFLLAQERLQATENGHAPLLPR